VLSVDSPYVRRARRASPDVRLFCFPYAGGGASVFSRWPDLLPDSVEVAAVQLPGREDRITEPAFTAHPPLVRTLAHALRPYLQQPVALFGHCAGALLAYEVAGELRRRFDAPVVRLFVSGQVAADCPVREDPVHDLADDEFRAALRRMEGAPADVLADDALMGFLSGRLRADFGLWERYEYTGREPLSCPITAFGGTRDTRMEMPRIARWSAHTTGAFRLHAVEGGHFFVNDRPEELTREIAADLQRDLR
jgi:medium-chain acyl-[acyl-carrier-protein] hydrolase